jgi:flagellum-specific peptidoglycan hydrolase FlgJ
VPLYLSKDTLAAADQATAEAQTSGLSDDVRQTMEQATKPPEPVASPWTIPSLESLGLPSLPSLPAATSPVMSAIGAVPQIGQRTVQMGQDAGQAAVQWALPSLEGLGVVPPKPQQPASDGSAPQTPSSSAPADAAAPASGVPASMPTNTGSAPPKGEIDNSSRASFARTAYPYALDAAGGDPELAKRLIASAISENGTVGSGKPIGVGFNFGGIKQDPVYGVGSGTYGTWESEGGQRVNQNDSFAHYPDAATGFKAIPAFLQRNFPKQWAQYQQDHDAAALYRNINAAGYATDQNWYQSIEGIAARDVAPNTAGLSQQAPAARPSPTTPPPAEQTPQAQAQYAPGSYTPNQINAATSEGLDYETALAVCGPAAAIAFARKTGRNPTMQEAVSLAREAGWTAGAGMAGPASEQRLLQSMGVAARLVDGSPEWQAVAADVQRGNPVIVSTPGHYFVAERYNPADGTFDFGQSAAVLKASGGRTWFKPEELAGLGMGTPRASLFLDSPASPSPSVVAGSSAPQAQAQPAPDDQTMYRMGLEQPSDTEEQPRHLMVAYPRRTRPAASSQRRTTNRPARLCAA